jgi:hypothetical protein
MHLRVDVKDLTTSTNRGLSNTGLICTPRKLPLTCIRRAKTQVVWYQ